MITSTYAVPVKCPICYGKLTYSYGEMIVEDTYGCSSRLHPNYQFFAETRHGFPTSRYVEVYERKTKINHRWTYEKWGSIPPHTLTVGTTFSPYETPRLDWFEPDFSDMATLMEKISLMPRMRPLIVGHKEMTEWIKTH